MVKIFSAKTSESGLDGLKQLEKEINDWESAQYQKYSDFEIVDMLQSESLVGSTGFYNRNLTITIRYIGGKETE